MSAKAQHFQNGGDTPRISVFLRSIDTMKILGISAFYHDSAATILVDGKIVAAAQEERFTRKKHDPSFPLQAALYCLEAAELQLEDVDAVVFYDKPLLKFERLIETYYSFAPKGLRSFIKAMPVWLDEKLFLKRLLRKELSKIDSKAAKKIQLLFPEHHLSHAASAFYPSPFEKAAILTVDGVGEWATASISLGENENITVLKELHFPHSLGLLYSAFTYFLGFKVNSGEYKLMGLAPYGNPESQQVSDFVEKIKQHLVSIKEDGSIWLDQSYFNYATGLRMVNDAKWAKIFGFPRRPAESDMTQTHCDLALAIQIVTEEVVLKMAAEAKRLTGVNNLCLAGGVALNCVANGKLEKAGIFDSIFVQPASGDAGGSLGAALAAQHIYFGQKRPAVSEGDSLQGSFLGPSYENWEIKQAIKKTKAVSTQYQDFEKLCEVVAEAIDAGQAIGWMQGRMEFGPRALGARSILGDPRNPEMQLKLNLRIKYRESFRPFAPSVLATSAHKYFDMDGQSPYMLMVHPVQPSIRKPIPVGYHDLPLKEKLYVQRSELPAITHIDFSARIQTVTPETNPRYWALISAFEKRTGCGVLVNTSFNVRGEPIVCTPEDAYRCFMETEMDVLVIGDFVFNKTDQPHWERQEGEHTNHPLD